MVKEKNVYLLQKMVTENNVYHMKNFKIALLYNIRHTYPDPDDSRSQLETDFDDPETTQWQIKHLEKIGYKVIPIEADEKAYLKLYKYKKEINVALNLSEGIYGLDREAQISAMLEMLQIPYTGSSPMTQALVLNKARAKEILQINNIPTLPFQLFLTGGEDLMKGLRFPLIVKPVGQGSSAGITNKSVIYDAKDLKKQIRHVLNSFHQPVLVEHFLRGREFSVAMLGNPPEILPIIESDNSHLPKKYEPLDSLEVKWYLEEEPNSDHLMCPAHIDTTLKRKLETMCFRLWDALGIRDWCRIDIRCDEKNNPYILEVNSPPGVIPPEVSTSSYFPLAARAAGIPYEDLLKTIINSSLKRSNK